MSKVLVDRELLERAMYANDGKELIAANRELRAILAQPAEAEGVELRVLPAREWAERAPSRNVVLEDEAIAALSAVTAERDRLRKDAERWRYVSLQGDDTHWLNLLRVDLEDFGGNINAAVDALIDGDTPVTAAKEA